jgi:hypothetical protein
MSEGFKDIQSVVGVWHPSRQTQTPGFRSFLGISGLWVNAAPAVIPPEPGEGVRDRLFIANVGKLMGIR